MAAGSQPKLNFEQLRTRLKLKSLNSERQLLTAYAAAAQFFEKAKLRQGQIRRHAEKLLTSGALASTLLLSAHTGLAGTSPVPETISEPAAPTARALSLTAPLLLQKDLAAYLAAVLPPVGQWTLSPEQEEKISKKLLDAFGFKAAPELEGNRLNHAFGRMGAEQHLPRYPGDSILQHGNLREKGLTPGLGGWGYFAYCASDLTPELCDVEKYYVAVQTLYLPNWKTDTAYLVKWYKHRRVVVVNPANGKVVVGTIADAGPADWTGKHFGGSPEMMAYLGINYGMQNHPVILFFLDDPEKQVPLGPVEYNVLTGNPVLKYQA
jgi:hypothetical protein